MVTRIVIPLGIMMAFERYVLLLYHEGAMPNIDLILVIITVIYILTITSYDHNDTDNDNHKK